MHVVQEHNWIGGNAYAVVAWGKHLILGCSDGTLRFRTPADGSTESVFWTPFQNDLEERNSTVTFLRGPAACS